HLWLSLKARLMFGIGAIARFFVARREADAMPSNFLRREPRLGEGHAAPDLVPDQGDAVEDEYEYEDEEEEDAPRARKSRSVAKPARKSSKFELPPLNVLAAPKSSDRKQLSQGEIEANAK